MCLPVVFHNIALTQLSKEVLVVGDDNQLEIVAFAFIDDAVTKQDYLLEYA